MESILVLKEIEQCISKIKTVLCAISHSGKLILVHSGMVGDYRMRLTFLMQLGCLDFSLRFWPKNKQLLR